MKKKNEFHWNVMLWDFNEDPPVIHVRAWQPKDTPDDDFIMVDDFR